MITGLLQSIGTVLTVGWWILVPLVLFYIAREVWLYYIRQRFRRAIVWEFLEIRVPRDVLKSPKAMEQVFAAAHGHYSYGIGFKDKWWGGEVEKWMAFEIVGVAGNVYLYVRTPQEFRNLIESAIYSQYPDAEITLIPSYLDDLPSTLPNATYDLYGTEFSLVKDNPYPVRTYFDFEDPVEEKRLDPLASLFEVMSGLKAGEVMLFQIMIRPASDSWRKEGEVIIDQIRGKKTAPKKSAIGKAMEGLVEFFKNLVEAPVKYPEWGAGATSAPGETLKMDQLTPVQKEAAEAIARKISKIGFETAIRLVYIDNRSAFTRANYAAFSGALRQFNSQTLNGFRIYKKSRTKTKWFVKKRRLWARKKKLFRDYRKAKMNSDNVMILNTEELATLFHFPTQFVEAPTLRRTTTRTGEAPPGLPVE